MDRSSRAALSLTALLAACAADGGAPPAGAGDPPPAALDSSVPWFTDQAAATGLHFVHFNGMTGPVLPAGDHGPGRGPARLRQRRRPRRLPRPGESARQRYAGAARAARERARRSPVPQRPDGAAGRNAHAPLHGCDGGERHRRSRVRPGRGQRRHRQRRVGGPVPDRVRAQPDVPQRRRRQLPRRHGGGPEPTAPPPGACRPGSPTSTTTAGSTCSSATTCATPSTRTSPASARRDRWTTAPPNGTRRSAAASTATTATAPSRRRPPRAGLADEFGPALGVASADYDGDGRMDLFIANDQQENQLWMNRGDGTFTNRALLAGVALDEAGVAKAYMGVDAGDFGQRRRRGPLHHGADRPGQHAVRQRRPRALHGAQRAVGHPPREPAVHGLGAAWLDVDNDGWLDALAVNGLVAQVLDALSSDNPFPFQQRNSCCATWGTAASRT